MRKEEIIETVEVVELAGHRVISFGETGSLPFEDPLAHYDKIFELKIIFCDKPKENMTKLIEGFHSIGYEVLVLDRAMPYPNAVLKIHPLVNYQ